PGPYELPVGSLKHLRPIEYSAVPIERDRTARGAELVDKGGGLLVTRGAEMNRIAGLRHLDRTRDAFHRGGDTVVAIMA
ncbi:MAG: hypothetical protein WCH40_11890, partial [Verrucomicrobiales bacterium]